MPAADVLQRLADRAAIVEAVDSVALLADLRDWDRLQALFADEVLVDYTSLRGGEPQRVSAAELVAGWRERLGGLDATQHVVANHLVEVAGDEATCRAHVLATHHLANRTGGPIWHLGGHYRYRLARRSGRWEITGTTLTVLWATGNEHLATLAGETS